LPGLRLLRQEPVECVFSFICSSNNNISRITKMLTSLRTKYGTLLGNVNDTNFYSFPTVDALSSVQEVELRELGFGYRANFVVKTAQQLKEKPGGGEAWLESLRSETRENIQTHLMTLMGVGRKVADCIALFSLDKLDVIPVDTHVWQIATRDYKAELPNLKSKAMSKKVYDQVGDFFRNHFGTHAGWAHSVMFTSDLAQFASRFSSESKSGSKTKNRKKKGVTPKNQKRKSVAKEEEKTEEEKNEEEIEEENEGKEETGNDSVKSAKRRKKQKSIIS